MFHAYGGNSDTFICIDTHTSGSTTEPGVGASWQTVWARVGETGDSAYQVWLDAGNVGTEYDFLESISGSDGQPGAPGEDGAPGADGQDRIANPFLMGTRVTFFGNSQGFAQRLGYSLSGGTGVGSGGSTYPNRLALRSGVVADVRNTGSATIDYITGQVLGGMAIHAGGWHLDRDWGVVVLDCIRNNIAFFGRAGGVQDPSSLAAQNYAEALTTMLRWFRMSSSSMRLHTSGSKVGTWTTFGGASWQHRSWWRGSIAACTTDAAGQYIDISFTGQEVVIFFARLNNDSSAVGGTMEIVYNASNQGDPTGGSVIGTYSCGGGFPRNPSGDGAYSMDFYTCSKRLTTADAPFAATGTNVVRLQRPAQGNTRPVYLQSWGTPRAVADRPEVYVINAGDEYPNSIVQTPSEMTQAYIDYRAVQTLVCAAGEFSGYVNLVDLPLWSPQTMTNSSYNYVHLNDLGAEYIAATLHGRLTADITSFRDGVHIL